MASVIRNIAVSSDVVTLRIRPDSDVSVDKAAVMDIEPVEPNLDILQETLILDQSINTTDVDNSETEPGVDIEALRCEVENELRSEYQLEHDRIFEQAKKEGYEAGLVEGEASACQTHANQISVLESLIGGVREALERNIAAEEDIIVAIAFEAICKILGTAMHDVEGVRSVVRQVMQSAIDKELLVLHVSPSDYSVIQADILADEERYQGIRIVTDERIAIGGCLIETESGTLDGRLETQLQALRETLLSAKRWHGESVG